MIRFPLMLDVPEDEGGVPSSGSANRCSLAAREAHLDVGGTASSFDTLLLVERPLPWPAEIADVPDIAEVITAVTDAAAGRRCRVQVVVGVGHDAPAGRRRLLCYQRRPDAFDGFVGLELEVQLDEIVGASRALTAGVGPLAGLATPIETNDVLICGHGARDRCCGSFGTRLAFSVAAGAPPSDVRLWRTSHTGGHRFAPTAVVLPPGDVWGNLEDATLLSIIRRDVEPSKVLSLYRGSAGMPSPATQLLDRFALGTLGWEWQSRRRVVSEERLADGTIRVRIGDDDGDLAFEGIVRTKRRISLGACGGAPGEMGKPVEELELLAVRYPVGGFPASS